MGITPAEDPTTMSAERQARERLAARDVERAQRARRGAGHPDRGYQLRSDQHAQRSPLENGTFCWIAPAGHGSPPGGGAGADAAR
jgi:hypothetical protein